MVHFLVGVRSCNAIRIRRCLNRIREISWMKTIWTLILQFNKREIYKKNCFVVFCSEISRCKFKPQRSLVAIAIFREEYFFSKKYFVLAFRRCEESFLCLNSPRNAYNQWSDSNPNQFNSKRQGFRLVLTFSEIFTKIEFPNSCDGCQASDCEARFRL